MIPPLTSELIALTKETSLLWVIGVFELTAAAKATGAAPTRTSRPSSSRPCCTSASRSRSPSWPATSSVGSGYEARMGVHL